jgi:hypothetical protein
MAAAVALALPASATTHASGGTTKTVAAVAAVTTTAPTLPVGEAMYNGKVIDLSKGWGGAASCIVPSTGNAQCFDTQAEAKTAANAISAQEVAVSQAAAASAQMRSAHRSSVAFAAAAVKAHTRSAHDSGPCQGDSSQFVWLYQNSNYGGASIGLQGTDTWWDMRTFAFQNQMSSYINNTGCELYGIQTYDGSGSWLYINPWSYTSYVGNAWNDKLTMLYIAY